MKGYLFETLLGVFSVFLALIFYFVTKDAALSFVLGILFGALAVYSSLIKYNVDSLLRRSVTIYELRSQIKESALRIKAEKIVDTCIRGLRELADGHYRVQGFEPAFSELRLFYDLAKNGGIIQSAVLVSPATILKGLYYNIHLNCINQGAQIVKVFIVSNEDLDDRIEELKAFADARVNANVVAKEDLATDLRLLSDFLILDKKLVAVSEFDSSGQLSGLRVSANGEDLSEYSIKFEELKTVSRLL